MDNQKKLTEDVYNETSSSQKEVSEDAQIEQSTPTHSDTDAVENPQDNSSDTSLQSTKQKNKFKKFIFSKVGIISIIAIIVVGGISWWFISKTTSEKEYENKLKEFVIESGKASMASAYVCEDLRSIWHDYIFEDKEYFKNSTGTFTRYSYDGDEYCSDFSAAVNRKIRWNEKNLPSTLTDPYFKAKRLYKEMAPPPTKYKDTHVYVKQMFKAMERLHELSTNPTGNLSAYSSNCNEAVEDYTSALSDLTNETDIDFSKSESDKTNEDDEYSD